MSSVRKIRPRETVIATVKCRSCGKSCNVLTNKNGNGYYYCGWSDEMGQPCNHHERWGRGASAKMRAKFMENLPKPANRNEPPATDSAPSTVKDAPAAAKQEETGLGIF